MKTKEDKIIDAIGGLSDKNVMLTYDGNLSETDEREIAIHDDTKSRKISVRRTLFGTSAAAVAAVLVLMIYVNGKAGNENDQLPVISDTVTETTEISTGEGSDDHTENNDTDEANQNGQLSFGTGPERPENYTPDRKYTSCYLEYESFVQEKEEYTSVDRNEFISDYLKTILVNESFADEIVSDYKSQTENYIESLGLNEGDYWVNYTINRPDYGACMNGYLEIDANISYNDNSNHERLYFVYDIVEEKMLTDNSDLFYYGEDYIGQIMTRLYGENINPDFLKPERITMTGMILPKVNGNTADIYDIPCWMYDISVTGRCRDLTGVIKDEYIDEGEYEEWYNSFIDIPVDDYTINTMYKNSRFHSESEINNIRSLRTERCAKVLDYLKNHHYLDGHMDKWLNMSFAADDSFFSVYEREQNEFLAKWLRYDTDKGEVLPADEDISEWRDYIKGRFEDEEHKHLITEMNFDSEKCDCLYYDWANWYYISEYSLNWANVPDNDYSIVLSDEEIENLDDVAFLLKIYDRETQEKHSVLVVMPFEKISNPELTKENFMGEPYSEHVRYWNK
jgi:hypothetical protein